MISQVYYFLLSTNVYEFSATNVFFKRCNATGAFRFLSYLFAVVSYCSIFYCLHLLYLLWCVLHRYIVVAIIYRLFTADMLWYSLRIFTIPLNNECDRFFNVLFIYANIAYSEKKKKTCRSRRQWKETRIIKNCPFEKRTNHDRSLRMPDECAGDCNGAYCNECNSSHLSTSCDVIGKAVKLVVRLFRPQI